MEIKNRRSFSSDSQYSPLFSQFDQAYSPNSSNGDKLVNSFNDFVVDNQDNQENQQIINLVNKGYISFPYQIQQDNYSIQEVCLTFNQLTKFPIELIKLKSLAKLILDQNKITSIPDQIQQLQSLKYLNLRSNQITSLSPQLGNLNNLEILYLCYNKIQYIPNSLFYLPKLKILGLRFNYFSELSHHFHNLIKTLDVIELDWFIYTVPPQRDKQFLIRNKTFLQSLNKFLDIYTLTQWPFNCLDFIQHFSNTQNCVITKDTLFMAIQKRSMGVVKRICLDKRHLIEKQNDLGLYPINFQYQRKDTIYPFLDFEDSKEALNILFLQCLMKKDQDLFKVLVQKNVDYHYISKCNLNGLIRCGSNALHCLMYIQEKQKIKVKINKMMKVLMKEGIDCKSKNEGRWNSLHVAAMQGLAEGFRIAVKYKERFNFNSRGGQSKETCLHIAGFKGQLEILRILTEEIEVNPFRVNKYNQTAKEQALLVLMIIKILRKAEFYYLQKLIQRQNNNEFYEDKSMNKKSKLFPNLKIKSLEKLLKQNDEFQQFQVQIVNIIRNTTQMDEMVDNLLSLLEMFQGASNSLIINQILSLIDRKVQGYNPNIKYISDTLQAILKLVNDLPFQQNISLELQESKLNILINQFRENTKQNQNISLNKNQEIPSQIIKLNINQAFLYDISFHRLPFLLNQEFFDSIMSTLHQILCQLKVPKLNSHSTRLTILQYEQYQQSNLPVIRNAQQIYQLTAQQQYKPYVSNIRENIKKSQRIMLKQPRGEKKQRFKYTESENISDESV